MADILSARFVINVNLAAEEGDKVIVKPASSVVSGVHDKGIRIAVLAESFGIYLTETRRVHTLNMHISDLSV